MHRIFRFFAIILLFFNAVSALYGGWLLISDPSGKSLELPLYWLDHSPFENYLTPGIILFELFLAGYSPGIYPGGLADHSTHHDQGILSPPSWFAFQYRTFVDRHRMDTCPAGPGHLPVSLKNLVPVVRHQVA
jgi:hypothetical protein